MFPPLQLWPAALPPAASRHACFSRETGLLRRLQLSLLWSTATAVFGRQRRLHPTTKFILLECTTVHMFSGSAKLCFIRDEHTVGGHRHPEN
jgi:hypothetical protein